jgi:hypothetical protein
MRHANVDQALMEGRARGRGWWAGGILGALLVTGCTTGGTPGPTPTAPTTASAPSTGPSPTSATTTSTSAASTPTSGTGSATTGAIPAAARVDSVDGSVEFVKFLVTEVNRAYRTPQAAILDSYIAASCVGCQEALQGRPVTSMADRDQDFFLTLAFESTWRVVRWQKA